MRPADLIALLSTLDPDEDVQLWNGFAQDYQDISPEVERLTLSRSGFDYWLKHVAYERKRSVESFTAEELEGLRVSHAELAFTEEAAGPPNKDYEFKRIAALHAVPKGKRTFDRLGTIEY